MFEQEKLAYDIVFGHFWQDRIEFQSYPTARAFWSEHEHFRTKISNPKISGVYSTLKFQLSSLATITLCSE